MAMQDEIRRLVEAFARDLEVNFRRQALAAVEASFGGRAPSAARSPGATAKKTTTAQPAKATSRKNGARVRRSPEQIEATAKKILDYVRANPGKRAEEIKKALGLAQNAWALPVTKLVGEGKLRVKGQKRATTYSA